MFKQGQRDKNGNYCRHHVDIFILIAITIPKKVEFCKYTFAETEICNIENAMYCNNNISHNKLYTSRNSKSEKLYKYL